MDYKDYTEFSVDQLRYCLVELGFSDEEAKVIKGKHNLLDVLHEELGDGLTPDYIRKDAEDADKNSDEFIIECEFDKESFGSLDQEVKDPDINHEEWVMSQFLPNEIDNGNPKINGLRRLANKIVGPIVFSGALEYTTESIAPNDPGRATCLYEVRFLSNGTVVTFRGLAGQSNVNATSPEFAKHPEAMAETRAEARALKKALGISHVASEELAGSHTDAVMEDFLIRKPDDDTEGLPATSGQKRAITKISERHGLDVNELLGYIGVATLDEITKGEGIMVMNKLSNEEWVKSTAEILNGSPS